jgi:hypothetical protein
MGPNRRAQERERTAARAAAEAKRAEAERKDAQKPAPCDPGHAADIRSMPSWYRNPCPRFDDKETGKPNQLRKLD